MISSKLLCGAMLFLVAASMMKIFSSGNILTLSSLDNEQKVGLAEFRAMVEKLDLPKEYMKDDAYLLRYLAAKDFNLKDAFDHLQHVLMVREAKKIENSLKRETF